MSKDRKEWINSLSLETLREELFRAREAEFDLRDALKDLPEVIPPSLQIWLSKAATFSTDWDIGKRLQQQHGPAAIPWKCECEEGAGLWFRIRIGLLMVEEEMKAKRQPSLEKESKP